MRIELFLVHGPFWITSQMPSIVCRSLKRTRADPKPLYKQGDCTVYLQSDTSFVFCTLAEDRVSGSEPAQGKQAWHEPQKRWFINAA